MFYCSIRVIVKTRDGLGLGLGLGLRLGLGLGLGLELGLGLRRHGFPEIKKSFESV